MLSQLIQAVRNADTMSLLSILISTMVLLLVCLPVHEMAHAFTANSLGDYTAKYQGRLTLNPLKHLDLIGSLMIVLIGVGYAKPVPVNMLNFKNRKRDMALTAVAGPISNLLMALVFTFFYVLIIKSGTIFLTNSFTYKLMFILYNVCFYGSYINISLAIFNLIPIPPFDGSRILGFFLPDRIYYKIMQYEKYIFIVVLILLWFGFLDGPLSIMVESIFSKFVWLFSLPFGG